MKRKSLWKTLGASVLVFSLTLSPIAALSVQAAATAPEDTKEGGTEKAKAPKDEVSIPVWGFKGSLDGAKIYSVDVEWGAMTFQYVEGSSSDKVWDPDTHSYKTGTGSGGAGEWQVYDSENKSVASSDQTSINQISVINHSNAEVKAAFSFQGTGAPAVNGKFTVDDGTTKDTEYTNVANPGATGIKLATADNDLGEGEGVGKEVIGKVFFMPDGPYPMTGGTETPGALSWKSLGEITVTIDADSTEETP